MDNAFIHVSIKPQSPCIAKPRAPITPTRSSDSWFYAAAAAAAAESESSSVSLSPPLSFPQNDMQRRRLLIRSAGGCLVGWGELSVPFLLQMEWKHIRMVDNLTSQPILSL